MTLGSLAQGSLGCVFEIVVAVTVQSIFRLEMHQNKVFFIS